MINNVTLVGRLTKDPVARKSQVGTTITSFTLAIDRVGQEKQTDFINCVVFGKPAEFVELYVRKGFLVGVVGRIQTRTYDDNTGRKVYVTEVIASQVQNYEPRKQQTQQPQESDQDFAMSFNGLVPNDDSYQDSLNISSDELPF